VVAKEQNRQRGGSVSTEDIALLGRDAGAQYVCVVERSELDGTSYVSTSIVSVQSKIAELSEMSELPRGGRIIDLIERQINTMLGIYIPPEPEYTPPAKAEYSPPVEQTYSEDSYTENSYTEPGHYTLWNRSLGGGIGIPVMINSINSLYKPSAVKFFINSEYVNLNDGFFRFGLNLDIGLLGADEKAIKQKYPDVDDISKDAAFINIGAFAKLYPTDFIYLSGGANYGRYGYLEGQTTTGEKFEIIDITNAIVFPVGLGLVWSDNYTSGFFIDAQYNIAMFKNSIGGYWSFNLGFKMGAD